MNKRKPYDTNKVTNTIKGLNNSNTKTSHRREGNPGFSISVILKSNNPYEHSTITIDVFEPKRYRTGTESITSCFWLNDSKTQTYISGSGSAGGCGDHKVSAAVSEAVASAGIELTPFSGCGDRCITVAVESIMRALGYRRNQYIICQR